jgi:hypothetical protein
MDSSYTNAEHHMFRSFNHNNVEKTPWIFVLECTLVSNVTGSWYYKCCGLSTLVGSYWTVTTWWRQPGLASGSDNGTEAEHLEGCARRQGLLPGVQEAIECA